MQTQNSYTWQHTGYCYRWIVSEQQKETTLIYSSILFSIFLILSVLDEMLHLLVLHLKNEV